MGNNVIFLAGLSLLASGAYASECSQKESIIQSLERSLVAKDRALKEALAYNKRLASQNHGGKVSQEERKMLQKALAQTKDELERTQKALKNSGKTITVYKDKAPVVQEKIVEKIVYRDNPTANQIAAAKSVEPKIVYKDKIVERIVYRDNPSVTKTIEPKIIYKDKIVYRDKTSVDKPCEPKIVYKDKVVEKIVYKEKLVPAKAIEPKIVYKDKIVEKIVYKEKLVPAKAIEPKIVYKEKIVVKEKPIEKTKVVAKTTLKAPAIVPKASSTQISQSEQKQRQIDKLALERERMVSTLKSPVASKPDTVVKKSTPSAYRLASNAGVYNGINGTKIDMWEQGRSFTSGTSSGGWVKITGYFVNRVWQPAGEEMWVKESDVIRR